MKRIFMMAVMLVCVTVSVEILSLELKIEHFSLVIVPINVRHRKK